MRKIERALIRRQGTKGTGVCSVLSPLEAEVAGVLWSCGRKMKAREIHRKLKKKVAHTSVAVILNRLYEKKILTREVETGRGGIHYIYVPQVSRADLEEDIVRNTVDRLIGNFGSVAVNYFNGRFAKR